jgi:CubicO group peptidase (beta-lactamase class C family)
MWAAKGSTSIVVPASVDNDSLRNPPLLICSTLGVIVWLHYTSELEPIISFKGAHMNSTSLLTATDSQHAMKAGIIKRFVQVTQVAVLFMAAIILAVVTWSSSLKAGNSKRPSITQTVKPMALPVDSATFVHLLDSLIIPGLEKYHIPGIVISIVHDSTIVLAKGYGYADVERKIPFDPDNTVIRIASVSKLFTGTAVLQLVERGMLDMHQDINTYLTRFKIENWPGKPITLHHLLTHTAGFDDRYIGKSARTQESQIPLGDFLATRLPRRIRPPGEIYSYSNFSNALAGFVVEEVTHEDYAAYVRRNILEPLGMRRSDYRLRPDLQLLLAQCYSHDGTGYRHNMFDFLNDYPGGQMLSTGRDMAKFMIAHIQLGQYAGKRILSEESAAAMHTLQFTHHKELAYSVGYSFAVGSERGQTVLIHDGEYTGVSSRLCLFPESHIGFFMACNIMDGSLIGEVSRKLFERFIAEPLQDSTKYPLTSIPRYDGKIAEYAGTYRFSRYTHSSFEKMGVLVGAIGQDLSIGHNEQGMILMDWYYGKQRRMIQVQPCLFQSIDDRYKCAFRRDASGKITHLFINGTAAFEKISWYETTTFQRSLLGGCLLCFFFLSIVLPIIRKIRKTQKPHGLSVDPVHWFAQKTAFTFLFYFVGLGIVMGFVIPQEEMFVGFAHGMHWTMYTVQTIALLGILLLAGLLGSLFWRYVEKPDTKVSERVRSGWLGIMTAVVGMAFVCFLLYWNMVGYQF